jgi:imidazolonepropionase
MVIDLTVCNARILVSDVSSNRPKKGSEMGRVNVLFDGAVAVKDEKIVAVGKSSDIFKEYEPKIWVDAQDKVVSPGFVECHTHAVFAGDRLDEFEQKIRGVDYLEILASGGGILSTVRQTRKASLSELVALGRKRLDKMLASGITTCEIKTGYGLDTDSEMKILEAIFELRESHEIEIIPTFMPAHAVPPEFKKNPDEYVDLICEEMLPKASAFIKKSKIDIPFFADVFCERNAFNVEQSRKILLKAKELGFSLKAHVDEFTNLGGSKMALSLGAVSIDHLDEISDEEIKLLADSETVGVITPTVNFHLGSLKFADARKLIDSGCAIAISTDYNPGSSPCLSMPTAMAVACRYQKVLPAEAFNAATVNSAFALGLGQKLGSIEPGKQADLVIFDVRDYREIVYEIGSNLVEKVIKKGKIVFDSK